MAGVQASHNPQQGRTDVASLLKLPGHTERAQKLTHKHMHGKIHIKLIILICGLQAPLGPRMPFKSLVSLLRFAFLSVLIHFIIVLF